MTWDKCVRWAAACIGAISGYVSGCWNPMLTVLACCMIIDYVTGVLVAKTGNSPKTPSGGISSAAGFQGLIRKGMILLMIVLASLLDKITGNAVFQTAAVFFYVSNEGISILENAALLGVPVPDAMKNAFEILKEKDHHS